MYKSLLKMSMLTALIVGSTEVAHAIPITYDFTANNFSSSVGNLVPNKSLSGSFTLDGSTVTGVDLTIGSYTFKTNEVGTTGGWLIGDTLSGVNGIAWGTNDFWLAGNFATPTPAFYNFYYSIAGVTDIFSSYTGSISVAPPAKVPEPSSIALLAAGVLGLGFARRRARK
ncbi:MAG: hypothetical protein JWM78_3836 [Verrucomicrobiaceae bacterium]|nr:hypothetical protein [Verrucomicrobiaceae bacterium]